jgi:hypothetical protein
VAPQPWGLFLAVSVRSKIARELSEAPATSLASGVGPWRIRIGRGALVALASLAASACPPWCAAQESLPERHDLDCVALGSTYGKPGDEAARPCIEAALKDPSTRASAGAIEYLARGAFIVARWPRSANSPARTSVSSAPRAPEPLTAPQTANENEPEETAVIAGSNSGLGEVLLLTADAETETLWVLYSSPASPALSRKDRPGETGGEEPVLERDPRTGSPPGCRLAGFSTRHFGNIAPFVQPAVEVPSAPPEGSGARGRTPTELRVEGSSVLVLGFGEGTPPLRFDRAKKRFSTGE